MMVGNKSHVYHNQLRYQRRGCSCSYCYLFFIFIIYCLGILKYLYYGFNSGFRFEGYDYEHLNMIFYVLQCVNLVLLGLFFKSSIKEFYLNFTFQVFVGVISMGILIGAFIMFMQISDRLKELVLIVFWIPFSLIGTSGIINQLVLAKKIQRMMQDSIQDDNESARYGEIS